MTEKPTNPPAARGIRLNRYRLWSCLVALFLCVSVSAQVKSRITVSFNNEKASVALRKVETLSGLKIQYNYADVNFSVTLTAENEAPVDVVRAIVKGRQLEVRTNGNYVTLVKAWATGSTAQNITGTVVDSNGEPIIGATVTLRGTKTKTVTDVNGNFTIAYAGGKAPVLQLSYVGVESKTVTVKDPSQPQVITLKENVVELGEVVATGMQNVRKDLITGSVSVVTSRDLKGMGITTIDRALDGMVAGLNSTTLSGAPGTRAQIAIRGANSLNGNTEPLWIVDGLPLLEGVPQNNSGNYAATIMQDGIGNILPEDIESISILKDASAAAIYGARAANGVIVITTKKGFRSKTQVAYSGIYSISSAPKVKLGMMNSEQKLRYEQSIIDYFGTGYAQSVGRGSLYVKKLEGLISAEEYDKEMNRLRNTNTNWFDEIFRPTLSQQHSLSLRGGSELLTYYTSLSFTDRGGILKTNSYNNAGILFKLDYRPIKQLILGIDVSGNTRRNKTHASSVDPFVYAAFANPYERPYDDNGNYDADLSFLSNNYSRYTTSGYVYDRFNILREINENHLTQKGQDLSATFSVRYEPLQGLIMTGMLRRTTTHTMDMREVNAGTYTSYIQERLGRAAYPAAMFLSPEYDNGELRESAGHSEAWTGRGQVDYTFSLAKKHLLSWMGAVDFSSRNFNNFGYTSPIYYADFRITGIPGFDSTADYSRLYSSMGGYFNTSEGQDRTLSYITNLRYGYADRYVLNFNARLDGADVIGNRNQYTPLWSVGARYNMHKEKFFKLPFVSELVLRGSYGYTGQIDRSAYPFAVIGLSGTVYEGNRIVGSYQYPNPTVKWARKEDKNVGIDLSFLNNRISVSADYYHNRTTDILTNLTIPRSTGRSEVFANGGVVRNEGWETTLNVRWVDNQNWIFSTRVNLASNKNVIERSYHDFNSFRELLNSGSPVMGGVYNVIGEETGSIYGWRFAGVNPLTGNPQYYLTEEGKQVVADIFKNYDNLTATDREHYDKFFPNRDAVPDKVDFLVGEGWRKEPWHLASMQRIGRTTPKIVGGFSTYLKYKNFELTSNWTFKAGHLVSTFNDYRNAPRNMSGAVGSQLLSVGYSTDLAVSSTNRQTKYLNYWQQPGDITTVKKFTTSNTNDLWTTLNTDDKWEKGDYLRLNDITLSYRFSAAVMNKLGFNNLVVGLNARNLVTFTKYRGVDVATGNPFGYPVAKEVSLRLNFGF